MLSLTTSGTPNWGRQQQPPRNAERSGLVRGFGAARARHRRSVSEWSRCDLAEGAEIPVGDDHQRLLGRERDAELAGRDPKDRAKMHLQCLGFAIAQLQRDVLHGVAWIEQQPMSVQ